MAWDIQSGSDCDVVAPLQDLEYSSCPYARLHHSGASQAVLVPYESPSDDYRPQPRLLGRPPCRIRQALRVAQQKTKAAAIAKAGGGAADAAQRSLQDIGAQDSSGPGLCITQDDGERRLSSFVRNIGGFAHRQMFHALSRENVPSCEETDTLIDATLGLVPRCSVMAASEEARLLGRSSSAVLREEKVLAASACYFGTRLWSSSMLSRVRMWFRPRRGAAPAAQPIACCLFGTSDSTPLAMRVAEDCSGGSRLTRQSPELQVDDKLASHAILGTPVGPDAPPQFLSQLDAIVNLPPVTYSKTGKLCKIYNSYFALAFVVFVLATQRYLTIVNPLNCPMHLAESGTADTNKVVMEESGSVPMWSAFASEFPASFDLRTLDRDAANIKGENGINYEKDGKVVRARSPCQIHITGIVQKGAYQLVSKDISGMIATTLACRPANSFPRLQEAMELIMIDSVRVLKMDPPLVTDVILERRNELLNVVLTLSEADMRRRQTIENDLHCNWGEDAIIWCTRADALDLKAWAKRSVKALMLVAPAIFNRSRWLKSLSTIRAFALPLNCHRLLERAAPLWVQLLQGVPRLKLNLAATLQSVKPQRCLEKEVWGVDSDGSDDEKCMPAPQTTEDWVEYNAHQRTGTLQFLDSSPAHRTLILHISIASIVELMEGQLKVAGKAWQEQQFYNASQTENTPLYRMTDAASCRLTNRFFASSKYLLLDGKKWRALPSDAYTQHNVNLAFAMIARSMGGIAQMLHALNLKHPTRLLLLLADSQDLFAQATSINADPPCMHEDLAFFFLNLHNSIDKLRSKD
jgi:hypothetical protein